MISAEDFVKEWQKADSVAAIAEKFDMTARGACARATLYRRKGVPLQKFQGGRPGPRLDIDGLIKLANEGGGMKTKTVAAKTSKKSAKKTKAKKKKS